MAILGSTSEPTNSAEAFADTLNHFAIPLTFPAGGPWRISRAAVWAAAYGANVSARTMIWRNPLGDLVYGQSNIFTMTARAFTNTGSDLYDMPLTGPFNAVGGATVKVGFGIAVGGSCFFGKLSSGSYQAKDQASSYTVMTGYSTYATGQMGAYLTYALANTAPNAPSALSPSSGVIIGTDLTPLLTFTATDPDGDNLTAYQIQVDNNADFSSPVWDSGKVAVEPDWASGVSHVIEVGAALARGTLYYWRARIYDISDAVSAWSA